MTEVAPVTDTLTTSQHLLFQMYFQNSTLSFIATLAPTSYNSTLIFSFFFPFWVQERIVLFTSLKVTLLPTTLIPISFLLLTKGEGERCNPER